MPDGRAAVGSASLAATVPVSENVEVASSGSVSERVGVGSTEASASDDAVVMNPKSDGTEIMTLVGEVLSKSLDAEGLELSADPNGREMLTEADGPLSETDGPADTEMDGPLSDVDGVGPGSDTDGPESETDQNPKPTDQNLTLRWTDQNLLDQDPMQR